MGTMSSEEQRSVVGKYVEDLQRATASVALLEEKARQEIATLEDVAQHIKQSLLEQSGRRVYFGDPPSLNKLLDAMPNKEQILETLAAYKTESETLAQLKRKRAEMLGSI